MKTEILRIEFVSKTPDQVNKLTLCNLLLFSAEIHGLMGDNSCGKSLLLKTLCGIHPGCEGDFYFWGRRRQFFQNPDDARRNGIFYLNEVALIPQWSILENIILWPDAHGKAPVGHYRRHKKTALFWLRHLCFEAAPTSPPTSLPTHEKLKIHLVKAMFRNAKLIILDYPVTQFNYRQIEELKLIITRIRENGTAVLITDYEYKRLMPLADSVTLMKAGRTTARLAKADIHIYQPAESSVSPDYPLPLFKQPAHLPEMLYIDHIAGAGIQGFTLRIPKECIISLIDNTGSSNLQIGRLLCGLAAIESGQIWLDGKEICLHGRESAQKNGIYCLAPTHGQNLLFESLSVKENLLMPVLKHYSQAGQIKKGELQCLFDTLCEDIFSIDTVLQKWDLASITEREYRMLLLYRQAIMEPKMIILFDFFSKMDTASMIYMKKPLRHLVKNGSVVINITMNPEEALLLGDCGYITDNNGIRQILR